MGLSSAVWCLTLQQVTYRWGAQCGKPAKKVAGDVDCGLGDLQTKGTMQPAGLTMPPGACSSKLQNNRIHTDIGRATLAPPYFIPS